MRRILFLILAIAFIATPVITLTKGTAHAATTTTKYLNGKITLDSNADTYSSTDEGRIYSVNPDGTALSRLASTSGNNINYGWSPDGTKITFASNGEGNEEIYTMNADGSNLTNITNNSATEFGPIWSPDGTKIAFYSTRDGSYQIYTMNADGSNQTRLTNSSAFDFANGWSPDGSKIVFETNRDGSYQIYTMNADGSNQTRLTNNSANDLDPFWSPDGSKIVFWSSRDSNEEIYTMNADGSNQTRLTNNLANDSSPFWSPDGTKIVFISDRDGNREVYAMNADGSNQTNISNLPDSSEYIDHMSPDGKKISFDSWSNTTNNGDVYSVNLDGTGKLKVTDSSANPNIYFEDSTWQPLPYTQTTNDDGSLTSTISSDKDYSAGEYTVANNETLNLDGKLGNVTVGSGGTLEGTGDVVRTLTVNSGGTIAPGHSPGCLSSGNLTLNGTYQAQIGGTTPCTGYDQIKVTGTVNLTGSTLTPTLVNGFVPTVGQSFTLIDNDSTDAVIGSFIGLAEGATFTSQGVTYKVSYVGGTGNDVTLTVLKTITAPNTGLRLVKNSPLGVFSITILATIGLLVIVKRAEA